MRPGGATAARISAVVPTYNSGPRLGRCLDALAAAGGIDEVIVLDGGSTDGTDERAAARPGVRVLRMQGTTVAHRLNKGVTEAHQDLVLLLDDDAFVDPGTPARLTELMLKRPRVGVAGARLRFEDGSEQRSAGRYKTLAGVLLDVLALNRVAARLRPAAGVDRATWLPLCAALLRKTAFEEIGGFDERFSFYKEDQDFARRLTKAGWETAVGAGAGAVHLGGGSTKAKDPGPWYTEYHHNHFLYLQKHYPRGWRVYAALWVMRAPLHMALWSGRALVHRIRRDAEAEREARGWVVAFRRAWRPPKPGRVG